MEIIDYPSKEAEELIGRIRKRRLVVTGEVEKVVAGIIEDVKERGDMAVAEYGRKFDSPLLTGHDLWVGDQEFGRAESLVSAEFRGSLERAAFQIMEYHSKQLRRSWFDTPRAGVLVGQMIRPVDSAGVYVPGAKGGKTPLVSSVLMGAIPARIAGVKRIVMATPPMEDGSVNPHLLVAAKLAGVDAVYKAGSAWAVAAMAFGTETLKPVDVIVGPGNIYVTAAKKMVSGTVGIDMVAGPSEILVIADKNADPEFIAADLLSQAEHDSMASAIMITDSRELAEAARDELATQLKILPRKDIAREALVSYGGICVVESIDVAFELANMVAPEHLELMVADPYSCLDRVRNAGAVFLGTYTPEPVGDYMAGPNHVLPTAGTARFFSALSVDTFMKQTSIISYSKSAFLAEADDIMRLAETEGLGAHARSVEVRKQKLNPDEKSDNKD